MDRKLALINQYLYDGKFSPEPTGAAWKEVYFHKGKWEIWCGRVGVTQTGPVEILRMIDIGEDW